MGHDRTAHGSTVYRFHFGVVRQNLSALVTDGVPAPDTSGIGPWGDTLGGVSAPARSSLGQDAAGDLLYAASMSALPSDLAAAQVQAGALSAMELDINPYWVQLDWAPTPGGPLSTGVPGQNRAAATYLDGWTRDFVTVLDAPAPALQIRLR